MSAPALNPEQAADLLRRTRTELTEVRAQLELCYGILEEHGRNTLPWLFLRIDPLQARENKLEELEQQLEAYATLPPST